jgi:hypothetical protein
MARAPKRPSNVPSEAAWHTEDQEWQAGTMRLPKKGDAHAVGEWRYWRKDGSLACIANFDGLGALDGVNARYHPDGSLYSRGEWRHGSRFGQFVFVQSEHSTPEPYPEDERTWRVEFHSTANWSEEDKRYFLKDGSECTSTGRPLDSAFDLDVLFDAATPEHFIGGDGLRTLQALGSEEHASGKALARPLGLEEIFGHDESQLQGLLALLDRSGIRDFSNPDYDDTSISPDRLPGYGAWGCEDGVDNLMEWLRWQLLRALRPSLQQRTSDRPLGRQ